MVLKLKQLQSKGKRHLLATLLGIPKPMQINGTCKKTVKLSFC